MAGALATMGVTPVPQAMGRSGSFSKTAAGPTVTSDTITITVPADNSGAFTVNGSITGTINFEYSKNGAGFAAIAVDGSEQVTVANGDTLAFRITAASAGEQITFGVLDVSAAVELQSGAALIAT